MVKILFIFLTTALLVDAENYCDKVIFTVFNNNSTFDWQKDTNLTARDCDRDGKFSFITHGWCGSRSSWILKLVDKLLKYRGGCVIFLNWGIISDDINYDLIVLFEWQKVSEVLLGRLQQLAREGVSTENIFMYGHSLGGRLVIDAGIKFGRRRIRQIDVCDSAGPGFGLYDVFFDPKHAAENVQCIHTSVDAGTSIYNCHQDWLMGNCGISQPAAHPDAYWLCQLGFCQNPVNAILSHDLCNEFYLSAFENNFTANNLNNCLDVIDSGDLPPGFKMGYMEPRKNESIKGIIAATTSEIFPYT